jgi:hypothetical protein
MKMPFQNLSFLGKALMLLSASFAAIAVAGFSVIAQKDFTPTSVLIGTNFHRSYFIVWNPFIYLFVSVICFALAVGLGFFAQRKLGKHKV